MHEISRAIAVANTRKPEALPLAEKISAFLQAKGVFCGIFEYGGTEVEDPFESYDFAITLGGDGTVLFAARFCAPKGIPVFPVNLGEFGFIAGIVPGLWRQALEAYLEGSSHSTERMLLRADVLRGAGGPPVYTSCALNDASLSAGGVAKIVEFDVAFMDDATLYPFGLFKADGIIVATPTGSTAYSAAAGGPIVSPDVSAFVLSPVCAFSLSSRPILLPSSGRISIDFCGGGNECGALLSIDGQESFHLEKGDRIVISEAERPVRLIGCSPRIFYAALRSKLNWSGAPFNGSPQDGGRGFHGGDGTPGAARHDGEGT